MNNLLERKRTPRETVALGVDVGLRISILFLFVLLFVPGLCPARISEKINRNLSLFTAGFFYKSLVSDLGRIISKGWIERGTMYLVYFSSMIACLGILAAGTGACLGVGNNKLKRLGTLLSGGGTLLVGAGLFGIYTAYRQIANSPDVSKAKPIFPIGFNVLLVAAVFVLCLSLARFFLTPRPKRGEKGHIEAPMELFLMLLPFIILIFVFSYLPLWGWRYAFFNYEAGSTMSLDKFSGFFWFTYLFKNPATTTDILRVIKNTLAMSGLGILTSWCPIAFAIFLAEIRNTKVRRTVQTLTTIPNFISWVLVYAVAFCIFSTDGFVSSMMINTGLWSSGKNMLMGGEHIWLKMLAWGMWKGLGWSAIMYIAAITAIDQQLYEAATVDGAGRFQKMWHITVPELIPTYMVLLLLSIAGILNNGMEQYFCFENPTNTNPIMVLDLYVYKLGIGQGLIPLSTVVGMVKSLVSVLLLFGANSISKIIRGTSIV